MITSRYVMLSAASMWITACAVRAAPASTAIEVEREQCDSGFTDASTIRLLKTVTVIDAEPIYSHIMTNGTNSEERVAGAKILIRPPAGVSLEEMTRALQCHGARALLGRIDRSELPDDPLWLPDAWVTITVEGEQGNYAVKLEANSVPNNLKLAAHAMSFANAHPWRAAGNPL
ncbi:MAG: hypothetical protein ABSC94_25860 [Polyangiaceae bacterium]